MKHDMHPPKVEMTERRDGEGSLTVAEALAWVAEMFEEPATKIQENTQRTEIAGWDSLGQLILMSGLDQRFGIRLTQSEIASLASVQQILTILARNGRLLNS